MLCKEANFVDFQRRARAFKVGDIVFPFHSNTGLSGRVLAVWPAIGMVDVEMPDGPKRYPVEELQISTAKDVDPPRTDSVPAGAGTVPVSGGPRTAARRVAEAWVRKAVYWNGPDRMYRATQAEIDTQTYSCPKGCPTPLRPAVYRRENGKSERLLGCPTCMFLVLRSDLIGHHLNEAEIH